MRVPRELRAHTDDERIILAIDALPCTYRYGGLKFTCAGSYLRLEDYQGRPLIPEAFRVYAWTWFCSHIS